MCTLSSFPQQKMLTKPQCSTTFRILIPSRYKIASSSCAALCCPSQPNVSVASIQQYNGYLYAYLVSSDGAELNSCGIFFLYILQFPTQIILPYANRDNFISSFLIHTPFVSLYCHIQLARMPTTTLSNKTVKVTIFAMFPNIGESFQSN